MSRLRQILLVLALTFLVCLWLLLAVAFGVIPLGDKSEVTTLFGSPPDRMIAAYSSGWEDHMTFLVFQASPRWVEGAIAYARLTSIGSIERAKCLDAISRPWWFRFGPKAMGACWVKQYASGGESRMHYDSSSAYVYVYDYSI